MSSLRSALIAAFGKPKAFFGLTVATIYGSTATTDVIGNVVATTRHASAPVRLGQSEDVCGAIEKLNPPFGNPAISERPVGFAPPPRDEFAFFVDGSLYYPAQGSSRPQKSWDALRLGLVGLRYLADSS